MKAQAMTHRSKSEDEMTTRIYEYQARPGMTVGIDQAQWMEGGCDVVIDSLHKVDDFHVPPFERRRMAEALYPEHNRGRLDELEAALVEARAVDAGLRAQLAAAENRTETHRVEIRRLTDKIAALQEPKPAEARAKAAEERAAHHVGAARAAVEQAEARAREAERERDESQDEVVSWTEWAQGVAQAPTTTNPAVLMTMVAKRIKTAERQRGALAGELQDRADEGRVRTDADVEAARQVGREEVAAKVSPADWNPLVGPVPTGDFNGPHGPLPSGAAPKGGTPDDDALDEDDEDDEDAPEPPALGHLADIEKALRPAPAAPTEPAWMTNSRAEIARLADWCNDNDLVDESRSPVDVVTAALERYVDALLDKPSTPQAAPLGAGPDGEPRDFPAGTPPGFQVEPRHLASEPDVLDHYELVLGEGDSLTGRQYPTEREAEIAAWRLAWWCARAIDDPQAETPRTIDPSTGHYGDPVVMECAGEPDCGQAAHHVCFMCSVCEAHRYPNTPPRSHWMASAPQGEAAGPKPTNTQGEES